MKINLIIKCFILLISVITLLNISNTACFSRKQKDYNDTYGVHLVMTNFFIS